MRLERECKLALQAFAACGRGGEIVVFGVGREYSVRDDGEIPGIHRMGCWGLGLVERDWGNLQK